MLEQAIDTWEGEGGSPQPVMIALTGTVNQIAWAEQIRTAVNGEFDRVRKALESAASKRPGRDRTDTDAVIAILEDKRAEVMSNPSAGYFIHDWQELRDQVRTMLRADVRYKTNTVVQHMP
jgi:cell division FtsZ-interacting protein ZapD